MHEETLLEGSGEERYIGGGCEQVSPGATSGSGSGGGDQPFFNISHDGTSAGVRVTVSGASGVHKRKFYSDEFLASGKVDEFVVTLSDALDLHLKYWGGRECEPVGDP